MPGFDAVEDVARLVGGCTCRRQAKALSKDELQDLGKRVWRLYGQAFPGFHEKLAEGDLTRLLKSLSRRYDRSLSPVPRRYVRALLHAFDLIDLGKYGGRQLADEIA